MVNMIYAFLRVQEKELVSLTERLQTRNNKSVLPFDFRPVVVVLYFTWVGGYVYIAAATLLHGHINTHLNLT